MPMVPHKGGIQRVTDVLTHELIRQGHNVNYLCRYNNYSEDLEELPAKQYCIKYEESSMQMFVKRYLDLLAVQNYDCVIFQWVDDIINYWLKQTPNYIKVICVIHQQPFPNRGYEREVALMQSSKDLRQWLWNFTGWIFPQVHRCFYDGIWKSTLINFAANSDKLCLLSDKFIPRVEKMAIGIDPQKICGINNPCFIDHSFKLDPLEKEKIVLFVGRIVNSSKNVFGFLNVWDLFSTKYPNWNAIVVGDGPDLIDCEKYATKKQIARVEFVGQINDVAKFYKRAKFQCITSFGEGFSMALVEGMSYGCVPFIFDTYESLHDIVDNTVNGFISPAFHATDMVNNMAKVADNEDLYESVAKDAIHKCSKFEPSAIVSGWISMINKIEK